MKQCLHSYEQLNQNITSEKSRLNDIQSKESVDAVNNLDSKEKILNALEECKSSIEQANRNAIQFVQQAKVGVSDFSFCCYNIRYLCEFNSYLNECLYRVFIKFRFGQK